MSNSVRIAVLAVIAVVAFGAASLLSGDGDGKSADSGTDMATGASSSTTGVPASVKPDKDANPCVVDDVVPAAEAGYEVTVATQPNPPVPQGTTMEVIVLRDGAPVSGATVCLSARMSEMSHSGVSKQAEELGEGRYQMAVDFGMRGSWSGGVVVIESGQGASIPLTFNVQ